MLVGVALISLIIRAFVLQMFDIPSGSMENTLKPGDKVVVNKLQYKFTSPDRGDIVVFDSPPAALEDDPDSPVLIKRIVGLPGESIAGIGGEVFVNGERLDEPYIFPGNITDDFDEVQLDKDQYFMMGDHRENSSDGRVFGPVNRESFTGKTVLNVWPINRFKIF